LKDPGLLPHWEEPKPAGDEKEYPFHLHVYKTMALTGSRNANQPWLQPIYGSHLYERWETWVEINPETAERSGISDRDWVWVESTAGKIKVRARIYKGAMPDVVTSLSATAINQGGAG
jgi:anaerobic selenocysteine-containing dehydrogenase